MSDKTKDHIEDEEDYKVVLSFVKDFFRTRKFIFTLVAVFLVLGIINVLLTPRVYTSKVTFITQSAGGSNAGAGLGGIAKLLGGGGGASSNSGSSDIPSFLYPSIMKSLSFQRKLYETPIKLRGVDSMITYKQYALTIEELPLKSRIAKYTIGLPKLLFSSKKSAPATVHRIDSLEYEDGTELRVIYSLSDKIALVNDEEDGTLEISASMSGEPVAAAQLAQNAQKILQEEIIRYRVGQAQEKFDFIEEQYKQRKEEYENAQARLARYNDSNLFNTTESSLIRKRQLESESNLLFAIYSDLEQQRLSQSIKIQEDTPTFTTINPAVVPLSSGGRQAIKTLLIFGVVGFLLSVLIYVLRVARRYVSSLWQEV